MSKLSTWRAESRQIMARIASENPALKTAELLKLIDAAYPFGQRKYWPYKQWLLERRAWIDAREGKSKPSTTTSGPLFGEP